VQKSDWYKNTYGMAYLTKNIGCSIAIDVCTGKNKSTPMGYGEKIPTKEYNESPVRSPKIDKQHEDKGCDRSDYCRVRIILSKCQHFNFERNNTA
jgi:hypothetical protein